MLAFESRCARRALSGAALGAQFLLLPALAGAQEPAEPEPSEVEPAPAPAPERRINLMGSSSPTIDLSTPPPPEPVGRTYHQHEGFYVRLGGGIGTLLGASLDTDLFELESSGATLELEALVGGSPAPGLAIGGGILGSLQLSGDWEADGVAGSESADLTTLLIGPFADGYPDPKKGWHFGGMIGLANVSFESPGGNEGSDALGFGGAAWAGYDVWVAPEWSIGGALRLNAVRASDSDDDLTLSAVGLSLGFSVLYH